MHSRQARAQPVGDMPGSSRVRKDAGQRLPVLIIAALVAAITFAAFSPALHNDFVNWDDGDNLVENPNYRGLGWANLRWMFTTFHMGPYQPLSWVTLGADYMLWGMDPKGYHLTNLLLHTANAVLFFLLARRLLVIAVKSPRPSGIRLCVAAAFASLLFAVHPLRVESVAWVTERRDVLNAFFVLVVLLLYVKAYQERLSPRRLRGLRIVMLAVYVCSLLSKAMSMTLPAVLLVLDVYPLRRLPWPPQKWRHSEHRSVLLEKIPFFLLGLLTAVIAVRAQGTIMVAFGEHGLAARLATVAYGVNFYLVKMVAPVKLLPLYEMPVHLDPFDLKYLLSAAIAVSITAALLVARRRFPAGLAAWIAYLVMLSPVSGIAQAGPQMVADRYTYLACMPFAVVAGGLLAGILRHAKLRPLPLSNVAFALAVVIVCALAVLTFRQTKIWRNSFALWTYTVSRDPNCGRAHNNLGNVYLHNDDIPTAIQHYTRAIELNPGRGTAPGNLGMAYLRQGDVNRAIHWCTKALRINPRSANAHYNLARVYMLSGDLTRAIQYCTRAGRIDPRDPKIHILIATAYGIKNDFDSAVRHYDQALLIDPYNAQAHNNLAVILYRIGRYTLAWQHVHRARDLGAPVIPDFLKALRDAMPEP